ncbi:hypothetical protein [Pelomonas sp. Root1444]|uniref:hypothetical protein n=1 Tax=Pelomonas sp. Root1444 TaxID=1736464 RepID=UPI0007025EB3|nr:hypothetical protein [Pelomonas sp. Root1444]KQY83718.1 hypothetical protein ASD35_24155 [Pelomonas sp. Root1444]
MTTGRLVALALVWTIAGCARQQVYPSFMQPTERDEAAYGTYTTKGTATLAGQAFLVQRGGGVVKAAGRTVTLDPATTIGHDWYRKAGRIFAFRHLMPGSPAFRQARRSVTADGDGRFKFVDLPAGEYYVRSEVTWEIGNYNPTQGGVVATLVKVREGAAQEVVLSELAR